MPKPAEWISTGETTRLSGYTKTTLYALAKQGKFPQPRRFNRRDLRWNRAEVEAWIAAQPLHEWDSNK